MVQYKPRTGLNLFLDLRLLWQTATHSSFLVAMKAAVISGLIAVVMKYSDLRHGWIADRRPEDMAFTNLAFLIGLIVVFRTNRSYDRLVQGTTNLAQCAGELHACTSLLLAQSRVAEADLETKRQFRQTLVRLVSMLYTASAEELDDECKGRMIDPTGLDKDSVARICEAETGKADIIFQFCQQLVMDHQGAGALKGVPPPLLTRCLQNLHIGFLKLQEARTLREVPFPFCYVAVAEMLLLIHAVILPFFMAIWTATTIQAGFLTGLQVFVLWSMNGVAQEMESPFHEGNNGFNVVFYQDRLNQSLLQLVTLESAATPSANEESMEILGERALCSITSPRARLSHARNRAELVNLTNSMDFATFGSSVTRPIATGGAGRVSLDASEQTRPLPQQPEFCLDPAGVDVEALVGKAPPGANGGIGGEAGSMAIAPLPCLQRSLAAPPLSAGDPAQAPTAAPAACAGDLEAVMWPHPCAGDRALAAAPQHAGERVLTPVGPGASAGGAPAGASTQLPAAAFGDHSARRARSRFEFVM